MRDPIYKPSTLTSGGTLAASGTDLGTGWDKCFLQIPAIASGSTRVKASPTMDGTYVQVAIAPITGTVHDGPYTVDSTITNCLVEIPMPYRYAKVESTSGCTDTHKTYYFVMTYK